MIKGDFEKNTYINSSKYVIPYDWQYITLWDSETRNIQELPNLSIPVPSSEAAYVNQGGAVTIENGPGQQTKDEIVFTISYESQRNMDGCINKILSEEKNQEIKLEKVSLGCSYYEIGYIMTISGEKFFVTLREPITNKQSHDILIALMNAKIQ